MAFCIEGRLEKSGQSWIIRVPELRIARRRQTKDETLESLHISLAAELEVFTNGRLSGPDLWIRELTENRIEVSSDADLDFPLFIRRFHFSGEPRLYS